MKAYIIFLRGVTPTGQNKVPMIPLREVLAKAGLVDVQTYIQSGNVLARSDLTALQVEKLVHEKIKKHFGGDLAILVRTPTQVRKIFEGNPFTNVDATRIFFTILASKPDPQKIKALADQDFSPDKFVVTDHAVYCYCPVSYGTSKLNNNSLERKLGVVATTRNYNTMSKLIELSKALL